MPLNGLFLVNGAVFLSSQHWSNSVSIGFGMEYNENLNPALPNADVNIYSVCPGLFGTLDGRCFGLLGSGTANEKKLGLNLPVP